MLLLAFYKLLNVSWTFCWGFVYLGLESAVSHHSVLLLLLNVLNFFESTRSVLLCFLKEGANDGIFIAFMFDRMRESSCGFVWMIFLSVVECSICDANWIKLIGNIFHVLI